MEEEIYYMNEARHMHVVWDSHARGQKAKREWGHYSDKQTDKTQIKHV